MRQTDRIFAKDKQRKSQDRRVVFRAENVAKVYRMGEICVPALEKVNLALDEGEFVVLLGPSGSGKSTLLNILGGLDTPTGGRVLFRDRDISTMSEDELTQFRRAHIGFVFQFYNLIPSLTAQENIALVESGVSEGDEVILFPGEKIKEGVKVK